jgi:hypothetical protein
MTTSIRTGLAPRSATTELAPAVGGEEYHFLAGAALGFSQPLGGFSRDDAREPELPRTHASRRRYARNVRGLVSCRRRPWDFPFRAFPSRRAVPPSGDPCFLASSDSTADPARKSRRSPTGFAGAPRPSHRRTLAGTKATEVGKRELPTAVISDRPVQHASCPARRPWTTNRNLRA